jgi:hypothetical protein
MRKAQINGIKGMRTKLTKTSLVKLLPRTMNLSAPIMRGEMEFSE